MCDVDDLYPPGPEVVPADLTATNSRYAERVVLVLLSLVLFLLVYVLLLVGSAYVAALAFVHPRGAPISFLGFCLFVYLFKGLFKRSAPGKSLRVEITEEEQPRLFAFIRRICDDARAPAPHRIFLDPEVNAAVFYEESILGLFMPARKNLLIGLGLVNMTNLSEFKAVMAHEFGHFSQNSMKLGQYVYVANKLILNMIQGRDWFDARLESWAWSRAALRVLRKLLAGLYYAITFLDCELSREMEYNADLVAVRLAGSPANLRVLARLESACLALEQAYSDLVVAAERKLYSANLFHHQTAAMPYLRRLRKDPGLGEPPVFPDDPNLIVEVFEPDLDPPSIWATHPTRYQREQNITRRFIRCPIDERSPWLLFDDVEDACSRVTWRWYRVALKAPRDAILDDALVVQTSIDEEHGETTYDVRYHGMYDNRYVSPGLDSDAFNDVYDQPWPVAEISRVHAVLFDDKTVRALGEYQECCKEHEFLRQWQRDQKQRKGDSLEFRGERYRSSAVPRLLKHVKGELERYGDWLAGIDKQVYCVHREMARLLQRELAEELLERYGFHVRLQEIARALIRAEEELQEQLAAISRKDRLSPEEFERFVYLLRSTRGVLEESLTRGDDLRLPLLMNVTAGQSLSDFLFAKRLVGQFRRAGGSITRKKIEKLRQQLGEVAWRARRLHFKSLGAILALQEEIARQWAARPNGAASAGAVVDGDIPSVRPAFDPRAKDSFNDRRPRSTRTSG